MTDEKLIKFLNKLKKCPSHRICDHCVCYFAGRCWLFEGGLHA